MADQAAQSMIDAAALWGIFARLLALIYVIAFLSIRAEIVEWAGARGLNPVREKLARFREDLGRWRALARYPTLLWFADSDRALRTLPVTGAIAAMLAVCGVASTLMFVIAWVVYLSCDVVFGMTYPWESLLLETGFLAIALPALEPVPSLGMSRAPEPILMFAFHWLLFRVVFGFGKNKFTRDALDDPNYLHGFLISQPIPSPLAWHAFRLPRAVLVPSHAALFVVEMVLPFFVFFPGWPRLAAAAGFSALMIGIQAMGNFGFFNMLMIVLCVTLLDPRPLIAQTTAALASPSGVIVGAAAAWSIVAGLCHLPFNTWVTRGWTEWPAWGAATGVGRAILAVLRAATPFRTVHAYGVFPPRMGPPVKFLPVVEGTRDGEHWETFEYRYMPSTEHSPPRFVAPHCPRLDHWMLYEGYAIGSGNYLGTLFSQGSAYDFSSVSTMDRLLERLMEPASPTRHLFRAVPFDGEPPVRARMRLYVFAPTTPDEMKATGRYWHRDLVGDHLSERTSDPTLYERWLPTAEQLHPDDRFARRRVARIHPLLGAQTLGTVRDVLDGRARLLWDVFWNELIPAADAAANAGWPAVADASQSVVDSYGRTDVDALDRIRGAVTTALLERLEPHVFGFAEPRLDVRTYFHAALGPHAVVLHGRARTEEALANPAMLIERPEPDAATRALMLLTMVRRDMMVMHARKQRLLVRTLPPPPRHEPAVPGFALLLPLLDDALPDANERIPVITRAPGGEWLMDGVPILDRRTMPSPQTESVR
jgi:hypothetical protein